MDKKQAQSLIKETFESTFDKGRFVGFVKNLLNNVEEATFIYKGNYIPDAYKQYINTLERIGKYTDGEHKIDILIAKLKKETSIERARTMQRNFVAWYLNGSRGGELKDAALVAFVAPNEEDWRFSLVKMDYRFEEGKKGRMRVKEEFTPARRWSFLVGINENSHTAQSQLVDLVADDERNPEIAQLEEAFNIEKVTKEFFEKYRELFLWTKETLDNTVKKDRKIREDFEAKGVDAVDFSKKLLGQIVFLYFLQKKGWFGVKRDAAWGTGPKNFLRELFEGKHGSYKNFFNDILEPLFYEALAWERDDDFYSRFNCKIPFLNGGLFDPINNYDWVHTDILLPDDLFSNDYKTKEGDKGNGILDIFDRYNFTVKEDEPLEKEVAVDPEMLGKVFENLLEVKDRKSKGTYYTPREIVHYMCQQSLINYLATELEGKVSNESFETLVKHGEHLGENETTVESKGRETDTYFYKLPESIRQNAELIDKKLIDIKVCDPAIGSGAFPVGMMGEIVKTRNVLTAYIKAKGRTIYNFKRECIEKSLYGVDIDPGAVEIAKLRLWLSLVVDEEERETIQPLPNLDYKIVQGNSLLRYPYTSMGLEKIEKLKYRLITETRPRVKEQLRAEIDGAIQKLLENTEKSLDYKVDFDFKIFFSEIFHDMPAPQADAPRQARKKGFDVVIANPPYINVNDMKEGEAERYRKIFATPFGSYDIYILFFEKSIEILKERGILTYITSNKYFIADYAKKLREFIVGNVKILALLDLADCKRVFEHAFVSPAITILQKEKPEKYTLELGLLKDEDINNLDNIQLGSLDASELVSGTNFIFDIRAGGENKTILKKLHNGTVTLDSIADVRTGVIGFEYWKMEPFVKEEKRVGHIRIITNGQIDRYTFIFGRKVNLYKKVFRHPYLDVEESPINENTKRLFLQKKIIIRGVAKKLSAQFDNEGFGALVAVHTAVPKDSKYSPLYLLALLNSSLFNWYHIAKFYTARIPMGSLKYPISFLKQLPIKAISTGQQKPFIDLVDKILAITKDDDYLENPVKQAKVREYEKQIDQLVYTLYDLTPEEIKIVEQSNSR